MILHDTAVPGNATGRWQTPRHSLAYACLGIDTTVLDGYTQALISW